MLRTGRQPLVSLRRGVERALVLASLVGLVAAPAFGQGGISEINGTVLDEGKALLPGVTITATNQSTGLARTATSGVNGRFVIPTLVPGSYAVKAEMQGFKTQSRSVTVAVGQEITLNFTLPIGGRTEEVTVEGEAPLVEVTASKVGADISKQEIDNLPSAGRSQLSLMQLVPGLTPSLAVGTFEGGQYNANGRDTGSNLFLVDGVYDNDDRLGGAQGTQARVTLDTMAEFQVLTHQYTAEYGGSSGVVVNAVSRSGSNKLAGRTYFYYQNNEKLNATDYFLKQAGEKNGEAGSKVFGGSLGGPIVKNKAFFFANLERTLNNLAANLNFPAEAAPLAVNYSDSTDIKAWNSFIRTDYQVTPKHSLSFRWLREAALTLGEGLEDNHSTPNNIFIENDNDQLFNFNWTALIGSHATNEFKVTHVKENLLQGNSQYFDDGYNFIELNGRDAFDVGSDNRHPDVASGPRASHGSARVRSYVADEAFTFVKSDWGGTHTFKAGATYSRNLARPQIVGGNDNGTYTFVQNRPFDPATPTTYPTRFSIRLGQIYFDLTDWRANGYVQDKWQLSKKLTLNLGVRYDYQHITPSAKNAIAPRIGVAFDPTGSGKTLIRGGIGKFYEYQLLGTVGTLAQQAVIVPSFLFDTGQDLASQAGRIPAHVCLQPIGSAGLANISPACRAFLTTLRNTVNSGGNINNEPTVDSDRKLGYLYSFSLGVKRQLSRDVAVSVDYVGNRGRDQTAIIDINEPVNGVRPGVARFDPSGQLIPAQARGTTFLRVLQFQTRDDLNSDYNSLEVSVTKRHANRWSGRAAYTLAKARDVGSTGGGTSQNNKRFSDDLNPRSDYGRTNFDNRHALSASANVDIWRGLAAGAVFRYYSGYPINELVGTDTNGDRDNLDRPVRGVNDATRPIQSPLDANGRAIRNGIDGESQLILDGRIQYLWKAGRTETGLFVEAYNLTNRVNFGNPTGTRTSSNFLKPVAANNPRTVQLGLRLTF